MSPARPRWGLLLPCVLLAMACATAPTASARAVASPAPVSTRGGHLVLIGGGDRPAAVMARFVALAGAGARPIVVFPMASEISREVGEELRTQLLSHGARDVQVLHIDAREDALRPEAVEAVRRAGGVFFSGGDQSRITQRLLGTPLMEALRELWAGGGVVGGTSAGSACQSGVMFVGEGDETVLRAANIVTAQGIDLFPEAIVDSHFVARKRQNRLVSLVLEHPERLGVGIDEATAVWVKPDRSLEVLGNGWVVLYDARGARVGRADNGRLSVAGLQQHVLIEGQRFDLQTRTVLP